METAILRQTIGCAGLLAIAPLLIGSVVALFMTDTALPGRLSIAIIPAAVTFVAALLLWFADDARHRRHFTAVREMLLSREEIDDAAFCAHFSGVDPEILCLTRQGIGTFFDVPPASIHPTDKLDPDLHFTYLEPAFHTCVTFHVLAERGAIGAPFTFRSHRVTDVGTLASEISRILKRLPNDSDASPDDGG